MSMNQHYSSETPWWTTQQEHPYQTMLIQATRNPATSPSNYSCPPQQYHPHQACFNSSNSHDPHTTSSSHHRYQASSPSFNLNIEEEDEEDADDYTHNPCTQQDEYDPEREGAVQERKPMFEKPLTPSDVGKLNRLVIPKQHAEKYFPLSGESAQQKGLLLSFEDESGKCWKFRYSYWNSSQSYVLTKGWSRYVKEKRLDAGDIVLFERDANDGHRLFIGWRRRRQQRDQSAAAHASRAAGRSNSWNNNINVNVGNGGVDMGWTRVIYSAQPYPTHQPSPLSHQPECLPAGKEVSSQTTTSMGSSSKVLRLFGVNMECQSDGSEPSTPSGSSMSSHALNLHQYSHQHQTSNYRSQSPHDHMQDITVYRDVNQMRSHRG